MYDTETRSMILNGKENDVGKDSASELVKNADSSIDLYFGPAAPAGFEKNWSKLIRVKGSLCISVLMGLQKNFSTRVGG